ncbi:MAG: NAD(P)H-quinone oxidoreductase [Actinomycetia bacterium]|nr:NAD(P)H-quinone oxidoreductase [Actinomycetes bacterium]MCP4225343.1 NAD(P)H-quinone oxidoreductase [Actinomycetes bacterium]MCP5030413.1 NAD(P)H-quinone oxidoreductase [Actinomycetes bacterium]
MRAVVIGSYGDPGVLEVREIPDPVAEADHVVIEVTSSALNRADLLQRLGLYPGPEMEHEVPGLEFSGVVAAIGPKVTRWSVGDQVMAVTGGGAQAERLSIHERQIMAIPSSVTLADAAAIPEVFLTAFDALVLQGGLASGGWALVHAGASGVGTAAIQIIKAIGARAVVTASAAKLARCRELGADVAVDYGTESFVEAVAEATGGVGVDVVLDVIGGEYTIDNITSLRVGGKLLQVGVMGRQKVELPLGMLLPKRASIVGTVLRARPLEEKAALTQLFVRQLIPRFDDGSLQPVIDRRFTIDEIADAHRYMETNANIGKVIIDVQ